MSFMTSKHGHLGGHASSPPRLRTNPVLRLAFCADPCVWAMHRRSDGERRVDRAYGPSQRKLPEGAECDDASAAWRNRRPCRPPPSQHCSWGRWHELTLGDIGDASEMTWGQSHGMQHRNQFK